MAESNTRVPWRRGWTAADRRIALIAFADALGTGTYLAGSAVFFTQAVGLTAAQVGFGLSLGALVGLGTTFPIGVLADRIGPRPMLALICGWRALGFAGYAVISGLPAFLVLACLLGVASKAMAPVLQALVDVVVTPERRVRTMALSRSVRNVGFSLGGLLAVAPLQVGTRASYNVIVLVNAASFVVAGVLTWRMREIRTTDRRLGTRRHPFRALRDGHYLGLTLLNGIVLLNQSMLVLAIPLWTLQHTSVPRGFIPVFLVINTVLVALFQVPATRSAESLTSAIRTFVCSAGLVAGAAGMVAISGSLTTVAAAAVLVTAVLLQTGGELLQSAASWQLSFCFAPEESRGSYLALFGLGSALEGALGPYLLTASVIATGAGGWLGLAAVLAAAGLLLPLVVDPSRAVEGLPERPASATSRRRR